MYYIYDIVRFFAPPELTGQSLEIFLGFGCVLFMAFLGFIFYKIARFFF